MTDVKLYVYDLSQGMAKQLSMGFLGQQIDAIYHTGIVVFGYEYFFGGGVCRMPAGMTPYGTPIEKLDLGKTKISKEDFEAFIKKIGHDKFRPENYNLFERNCNNFTDECSLYLLNKSIPEHILGLPSQFLGTPIGQMMKGYFDQMMGAQRPQEGTFQDFSGNGDPEPVQEDKEEIITFNKASLAQVLKKFASLSQTSLESEQISQVEQFVTNPSQNIKLVQNVLNSLVIVLNKVEEKDAFCILDLIRLMVCEPLVLNFMITKDDRIHQIVFKLMNSKPSMPTRLMILRFLVNHFESNQRTIGVEYVLGKLDQMVDFITDSITSQTEGIRLTSASLICNIAIFVKEIGDSETQILCSLIEYIVQEKSAEVVDKMLLGIYRFVKKHKIALELSKSLGFDVKSIHSNSKWISSIKNL